MAFFNKRKTEKEIGVEQHSETPAFSKNSVVYNEIHSTDSPQLESDNSNEVKSENEESAPNEGTSKGYEIKRMVKNPSTEFTPNKQESEEDATNNIYIDILLDCTYSAHLLYSKIYSVLINILNGLEKEGINQHVKFYFGLTIMQKDVKDVMFDEYRFTERKDEVVDALKERIEFYGGSFDGYESINEAIEHSIVKLGNESQKDDKRGLLFISDSMPKINEKIVFSDKGKELRFVRGYMFSKEYSAVFNMNERHKSTRFSPIMNLIGENSENEVSDFIQNIVRKTSITVSSAE